MTRLVPTRPRWERLLLLIVTVVLTTSVVGPVLPVEAAPTISIDRVTTTEGDEQVTGIVRGQPIQLHLQYGGLGAGAHSIEIRDAQSGEPVINTTVAGHSGTARVTVAGSDLDAAYAAPGDTIDLRASTGGAMSDRARIDKVDTTTMYLTDVPQQAGRNASVTVRYYGWTRATVDVSLYADHSPLADNGGEDSLIEQVHIEPSPGSSLPDAFDGTITFVPSQHQASPSSDSIRVQLRESAQPQSDTYWGNSARIEIVNEPPIAEFGYSPTSPRAGQSIAFDATSSRDPDGRVVGYAWDFDEDGQTDANGARVNHTFTSTGVRTVTLTVTDDVGATNRLRVRVPILVRPQPAIDVTPPDPVTDRPVTFNGTRSVDPDGQIDRYAWDVDGDGQTDAVGQVVTHTYLDAGDYDVSLTVTDDDGATNATTTRLSVEPLVRPSANLAHDPAVPRVNRSVTFDASGSADPDGQIDRYEWAFGDGVTETTTEPRVTHAYGAGGNYTATVTVVDNDGATGVARTSFRVNRPPVIQASATPPRPLRDEPVTVDAAGTRDPDGRVVGYAWTFGDGSRQEMGEAVVRHTYAAFGTYTLILTAVDDDGANATARLSIPVENRAPTPAFRYVPFNPKPDRGVRFDASASSDPDGTIDRYAWDFDGDGAIDATGGPTITHTFLDRGTYDVALIVEDDAGATNQSTRRIRVGSALPGVELALIVLLLLWAFVFFWLSGTLPGPGRVLDRLPEWPWLDRLFNRLGIRESADQADEPDHGDSGERREWPP